MRVVLLQLLLVTYSCNSLSFSIDYERDCYAKDGECYRYISGEMHYFRIPEHHWIDRLTKLRAAGFTTVQTYIPWNVHMPEENTYHFSGIADVYRYLELSQRLGLTVIIRPGPFLATEWDYGGFPAWLLRDRPTLDVRRNETVFMTEVRKWYEKLLPTLVPYLYHNGGPVIAVQVENEFGSNKPCDAAHYDYLHQLRDIYRHHLGPEVVLLTVDGDSHRLAKCGNIGGLYSTVNFGAGGNIKKKFRVQRQQEPRGPYACSAFFSGWLDHWGHPFNKVSADAVARSLKDILEFSNRSASVSMYMFHGGTNFAYMQGGRGDWNNETTSMYPRLWGKMTSYDYDAPLSEAGDTTPKYWKLREVISNYSDVYPVPKNTTKQDIGEVQMHLIYDILTLIQQVIPLHAPEMRVSSRYPLPMEQMGQNHGIVVYSTKLPDSIALPAQLDIQLYGDRVYVFTATGDTPVQVSSRNRPYTGFTVDEREVFILVEDNGHSNTGHVRYSYQYYQKGIIGNVTANGQVLEDWDAFLVSELLPKQPYGENFNFTRLWTMLSVSPTKNRYSAGKYIPTFYWGDVSGLEGDSFVEMSGWGKGILTVLGDQFYNLGRYWPLAGPQHRLFCPSEWCSGPKRGLITTFLVLELEQAPTNLTISVKDTPLVDGPYDESQT